MLFGLLFGCFLESVWILLGASGPPLGDFRLNGVDAKINHFGTRGTTTNVTFLCFVFVPCFFYPGVSPSLPPSILPSLII